MNNRSKPVTPYERLLRQALRYHSEVAFPRRLVMFSFLKDEMAKRQAWRLDEVRERVLAADALGWNVEITVNAAGDLVMTYLKRPTGPEFA